MFTAVRWDPILLCSQWPATENELLADGLPAPPRGARKVVFCNSWYARLRHSWASGLCMPSSPHASFLFLTELYVASCPKCRHDKCPLRWSYVIASQFFIVRDLKEHFWKWTQSTRIPWKVALTTFSVKLHFVCRHTKPQQSVKHIHKEIWEWFKIHKLQPGSTVEMLKHEITQTANLL